MTELNQTQIEIIASLKEYESAQKEMAIALRIGPAVAGENQGHNVRAEAAQAKLDAIERALPDRATIEVAVLVELKQLGDEYYLRRAELKAAVEAEMAAWIERDTANIRVRYAKAEPILGLSLHDATRAAHQAQENYNKLEYQKRVVEGKFFQVHKRTGTNPDPARFPAQAAARVDALLGDFYERQHLAGVKEKFGITDSMLGRMVT